MSLIETKEREKLYSFVADALRPFSPRLILDIACGEGEGTGILNAELHCGIIGADIEPKFIGGAKARQPGRDLKFIVADCRHTGFSNGEFDAVVSLHTIEHLGGSDQNVFLKEMRRIVKPGGVFVLATPDADVWRLQGIAGEQEDHIKELNRQETEGLLAANGFDALGVYGQFVLRTGKNFGFRKFLNFVKRLDVFRLRRFLGKGIIDRVDMSTQPVSVSGDVALLSKKDRASVNVFVCRKSD